MDIEAGDAAGAGAGAVSQYQRAMPSLSRQSSRRRRPGKETRSTRGTTQSSSFSATIAHGMRARTSFVMALSAVKPEAPLAAARAAQAAAQGA